MHFLWHLELAEIKANDNSLLRWQLYVSHFNEVLFIQPFSRVREGSCVVDQVLQHSVHHTSYDVSGTQSQEEDRKDVISVHASLPVSPSLMCL